MTEREQRRAARQFAEYWTDKGNEKSESQSFWLSLLRDVFGQDHPEQFISFEDKVLLKHMSFIDARIRSTRVLIEQKGRNKDLLEKIKQSDGSMLTSFEQAKRYVVELPVDEHPRWLVTSNFQKFLIYDMNKPQGEPEEILLENLEKEYYRLKFLVDTQAERIRRETEVSLKAGQLVGELYEKLLSQYQNPDNEHSLHSLNVLCVRLVFCLYAEDAGILGTHNMFHDYLREYKPEQMRRALIDLFDVLDTPVAERDPYIAPSLAAFPYVNGGLFSRQNIEIPQLNTGIADTLLNKASLSFNWSDISPTIFGAVFESTLNPETRRKGGMHYTSIENIHRAIDPLFLDNLTEGLGRIKRMKQANQRTRALAEYQQKLAALKFLDPACGSGNFLTETYLSLRRLENQVLEELYRDSPQFGGDFSPIKVSIHQFYGIEINDFASTVATTALWIAEAQMMAETERIVGRDLEYLPLKSYSNITEGNALRVDWANPQRIQNNENTAPISRDAPWRVSSSNVHDSRDATSCVSSNSIVYDYIIGNPPFVGYSLQSKEQKSDLTSVLLDKNGKTFKMAGKLDYVSGWYYKAAQLMCGAKTKAALVSTNSITQGEQVAGLWKPLTELFDLHVDFAWQTFQWDSESNDKAHVHCVIIGFSSRNDDSPRYLFNAEGVEEVQNISPYLIDAPTVFIESRKKALCEVPEMVKGSQPTDGGNFMLTAEERSEIIKKEPAIAKFIHRLYGAEEFINNKERYCFWLVDASPKEIHDSSILMKRVEGVRQMRLESSKEATRKIAQTPSIFGENRQPITDYIIVPSHSSENREYIPLGFLSADDIVTNAVLVIPSAQLYHFAILTSSVHMAWMRAVCGRLEMRYRYSKDVVYNNFPWPKLDNDKTIAKLEETAQAILDARNLFPDSTLADLYNETTMPPALRKAHNNNDKLVMKLYGFSQSMTEQEIVAELMKLYQELAK